MCCDFVGANLKAAGSAQCSIFGPFSPNIGQKVESAEPFGGWSPLYGYLEPTG